MHETCHFEGGTTEKSDKKVSPNVEMTNEDAFLITLKHGHFFVKNDHL